MVSIHSSPIGDVGTRDTGGMSVYIRELAKELGRLGHRVDIYTRPLCPEDSHIVELSENVRLVNLFISKGASISKLKLYSYLPDFFRAIEEFRNAHGLQYDLIHSHYWLSGCLGNWAKDCWNVPHVIKFHTLGAAKNKAKPGTLEPELRIAAEKKLSKTCDRIVVSTEKEKENLIRYYNVPRHKIGVVPCGVNLHLFRPVDKAEARRHLDFAQDASIILYVGRFDPLKGIERLLEAIIYLRHHKRFRLVIIGGDDHQSFSSQKILKLVRKLGIKDVVNFTGRIEQNNLNTYYNAADVLVVPSYYESFGLVALESLACGTPVIATPVGAMESIIHASETGQVLLDSSPRSLARAIESFIAKQHAKIISPQTVRASVRKFSWSHMASAIMDEYVTAFHIQQSAGALAFYRNYPMYSH
jgi:D-inositol-3-phosphate glycosyltransferase